MFDFIRNQFYTPVPLWNLARDYRVLSLYNWWVTTPKIRGVFLNHELGQGRFKKCGFQNLRNAQIDPANGCTLNLTVEVNKVVDGAERGRVLWSQCLLITSHCTVEHHLRIFKTALIDVEDTQDADGVKRGRVFRSRG